MSKKNAELETETIQDGRQSQAAANIQRGVCRMFEILDYACISELPLSNSRRADVVALSSAGAVIIVEIKSCLADFRADEKWPDYKEYCDQLYFAVGPDFPIDVLPADEGVIIADKYGGEILKAATESKLPGGRRKAMTIRFARTAASRLQRILDPKTPI